MEKNQVFNEAFLKLDIKSISDEIKKNGFFSFDNALNDNFIKNINNDVKKNGLSLNNNDVAGVFLDQGKQFILTHMFAISKSFFQCLTSKKIIDISSDYLGEEIRLKSFRYYENFAGGKMPWHTDNRINLPDTGKGKNIEKEGLIFLAYISDVEEGEFQYIKGSHKWSTKNKHNDYSEEEVEKNFKNDIVGFKKPKGSILIYSTYGVHRAKPFSNKNFIRKNILFRVDADTEYAEPVIIRTEFLNYIDDKIKSYLGFGKKSGQETWPKTGLDTMPLNKKTFKPISRWFAARLVDKLPGFFRRKIKKFFDLH